MQKWVAVGFRLAVSWKITKENVFYNTEKKV